MGPFKTQGEALNAAIKLAYREAGPFYTVHKNGRYFVTRKAGR